MVIVEMDVMLTAKRRVGSGAPRVAECTYFFLWDTCPKNRMITGKKGEKLCDNKKAVQLLVLLIVDRM
jgi:hypothetical protein